MSMNLIGYFLDSKDRKVMDIPFCQTPTKTTYDILGDNTEIKINKDNWEELLKEYFDWLKAIEEDEEYLEDHKKDIGRIIEEWGEDYQGYLSFI